MLQSKYMSTRELPDLLALRMQYTLSQQRLGEIIGVSKWTVGRWERGDTPSATYLRVLRALPRRLARAGVPPDKYLPRDQRRAPPEWFVTLKARRKSLGMSQAGIS